MNRVGCAAALLLFSLPAFSGEREDSLAARLVLVLRYDRQMDSMHETCLLHQKLVTPESLVARSPGYFDGLTPASPQWPKIVAAFAEYQQQICSRPTKSEGLQALSAAYAKTMTARQLQESIDFYSSETGRALADANQGASAAFDELTLRAQSQFAADLTAELSKKIRALSAGM